MVVSFFRGLLMMEAVVCCVRKQLWWSSEDDIAGEQPYKMAALVVAVCSYGVRKTRHLVGVSTLTTQHINTDLPCHSDPSSHSDSACLF